MRLADVPTPALCVDVDALDRNIARMAAFFRDRPCGLRPHFKAHKTPAIAQRQAAAGCVGFTCQTVHEAAVLAAHGLDDLLISNEVVDPAKRALLASVCERARVTVAIDSDAGIAFLRGLRVEVLIDVNVGLPRCGVLPDGALDLARLAVDAGLRLRGVMGYEGHAMALSDGVQRGVVARESMTQLCAVADRLRAAGLPVDVVSAGGTCTYDVTGAFPGVNEVQAGTYVMMDRQYGRYGLAFEEALRCLSTVVSRQGPLAAVDAGLKALATDHGQPELPDDIPADVLLLSDEHTTLAIADAFPFQPGDRLWMRPAHLDPTVNLHDRLYAIRGNEVVDVWPIAGRGYPAPFPA